MPSPRTLLGVTPDYQPPWGRRGILAPVGGRTDGAHVNLGYALAAVAGILIAAQVTIMGRNAPRVGPFTVALLVHVGGLVIALAVMLLRRGWGEAVQSAAGGWWVVPGIAGFFILSCLSVASARVGAAVALALSVATQLAAGLVLDARLGVAPINLKATAGIVMIVAGTYLVAARTSA